MNPDAQHNYSSENYVRVESTSKEDIKMQEAAGVNASHTKYEIAGP